MWSSDGAHSESQNQKRSQRDPADADVPCRVLALHGERSFRAVWTRSSVYVHAYRPTSDMVPGQPTGSP